MLRVVLAIVRFVANYEIVEQQQKIFVKLWNCRSRRENVRKLRKYFKICGDFCGIKSWGKENGNYERIMSNLS